jgi:Ca2+-binding EF-hand superfamily protein
MAISMKRGSILAAVAALAAAAPTLAAPAKPAPAKPAAAPAKGDVTRAEMQAETKRVFDLADTNKNGFMEPAEFRKRMGAVLNRTPPGTPGAPTKEDAQKMLAAAEAAFKAVDTNGDGKVSLSEASKRPLAAFDSIDANHDGVLTVAEKLAARTPPAAAAKTATNPSATRKLEAGR